MRKSEMRFSEGTSTSQFKSHLPHQKKTDIERCPFSFGANGCLQQPPPAGGIPLCSTRRRNPQTPQGAFSCRYAAIHLVVPPSHILFLCAKYNRNYEIVRFCQRKTDIERCPFFVDSALLSGISLHS